MEKKLIEPLHSACRIESNFTRYAVDVPLAFSKRENLQRTDDFSYKDNISVEMGRGTRLLLINEYINGDADKSRVR